MADRPPLPSPEDVDLLPVEVLPAFLAELAGIQKRAASRFRSLAAMSHVAPEVDDPDRLLDAEAVAAFLRVPKSQVEELGRRGALPRVLCGKYVRFRLGDVRDWIKRNRELSC